METLGDKERFWIIVFFQERYQVLIGLILRQRWGDELTNEGVVLRAYDSQKRRDQLGVLDSVGGNEHLKPLEVSCDSFTIRIELLHLTNGPVSEYLSDAPFFGLSLRTELKVQSLIDEAQVSTIHICETSKHTILLQSLTGVVPIKSRVGWYQVPAPGTARLHGSPGCGPALKTEGLHHHTMDRVGFLSHDGS